MAFLKNEFDARGVVAMRNLVPPEALNALRAECSQLNDQTSAQALIESDCKSSIRIVSNLYSGAAADSFAHYKWCSVSSQVCSKYLFATLILSHMSTAWYARMRKRISGRESWQITMSLPSSSSQSCPLRLSLIHI